MIRATRSATPGPRLAQMRTIHAHPAAMEARIRDCPAAMAHLGRAVMTAAAMMTLPGSPSAPARWSLMMAGARAGTTAVPPRVAVQTSGARATSETSGTNTSASKTAMPMADAAGVTVALALAAREMIGEPRSARLADMDRPPARRSVIVAGEMDHAAGMTTAGAASMRSGATTPGGAIPGPPLPLPPAQAGAAPPIAGGTSAVDARVMPGSQRHSAGAVVRTEAALGLAQALRGKPRRRRSPQWSRIHLPFASDFGQIARRRSSPESCCS